MHMCTKPVESEEISRTAVYRTPWGVGRILACRSGLVRVELPGVVGSIATEDVNDECADDSELAAWTNMLEAYFRGERLGWSVDEVPWAALRPAPFDRAVYEALMTVEAGSTISYGRLAELAGHARAARAVGSAMARNPLPIIIPCHRVIRADGILGNYANDATWKPRLLSHERAMVEKCRPA
jgi:methylated-DNA-[protein]-cysteine S-methyltransferase